MTDTNTSTTSWRFIEPIVTASLGLIAGISIAHFNSYESTNRLFLEKQIKVADDIANSFSNYIENWERLITLRKAFDLKDKNNEEISVNERDNFKKIVSNRSIEKDKLFSALDSTVLYYDKPAAELVYQFKYWDVEQASLTIDKLPNVSQWREWQIKILQQLRQEIKE